MLSKTNLFIAALLLMKSTCVLFAQANAIIFNNAESADFSRKDLTELLDLLNIRVNESVQVKSLDTKLKKIYQEAKYEVLFLEYETRGKENVLVVKGSKLKKIDKITFSGLDNELSDDFKRDVEIREGKAVGSKYLSNIRTRVEGMLEQRGYFHSQTEVKIIDYKEGSELELEVVVKKNNPTVVNKILFKGVEGELEDEVRNYLTFSVGDVFTKKELMKSRENINRYFKQNQYPTTRIEESTLIFGEDKLKVDIVYLVKQGEKYQFQFSGNKVYPDVILREFITEEVLSQVDATNKIILLIENKYKASGYHFCQIKVENVISKIDKLNTVYFNIEEGSKLLIDRLNFNGGERIGNGILSDWFYEEAPGVLSQGVYWEAGLTELVHKLQTRLHKEGYLSATLTSPRVVISTDRLGVELIFEIQPGQRTYLQAVEIRGSGHLENSEVLEEIKKSNNQPFHLQIAEEIKNRIQAVYLEEGFVDVEVKGGGANSNLFDLSKDQKQAVIKFNIVEGQQYYMGELFIDGNKRTQRDVIEREMRIKRGDKFDLKKVRASEDEISQLGLFSRVEIISTTSTKSSSIKDLRIMVIENKRGFGEVGLGGAYEDPRIRLRTFLGLAYKNILGLNQTVNSRTEMDIPFSDGYQLVPFLEYSSILGYRMPYPLSLPFTFSSQAGLDRFEVATSESAAISKVQTRSRIEEKIERKISSHITVLYRLHRYEHTRNEEIQLKNRPLIDDPTDPTKKVNPPDLGPAVDEDIGSTGPGLIVDFRDDAFNPTKGSYHSFEFELANKNLLSQSDFYMATLKNSFYIPLFYSFGLSLYLGGSFAESMEDLGALPKTRRVNDLALGGQASIRGYPRKIFAPEEGSYASAFYNTRFELTFPMFTNTSVAVFLDSGQLYSKKFGGVWKTDPRYDGVGIGIRYKTPVGPVVFDLAEGLTAPGKVVKFLFNIGTF